MARRQLTNAEWALVDIQLSNGTKPHEIAREFRVPEATIIYRRDGLKRALTRPEIAKAKAREAGLVAQLQGAGNDERFVVLTLRLLAETGNLGAMLGGSPIAHVRLEFDVRIGRIDMLLIHEDGGISVIEAKAVGALAHMAGGIGQILLYSHALIELVGPGEPPPYVNGYLAAPVEGHASEKMLAHVCRMGGVRLIALPARSVMRGKEQALYDRDMAIYRGA